MKHALHLLTPLFLAALAGCSNASEDAEGTGASGGTDATGGNATTTGGSGGSMSTGGAGTGAGTMSSGGAPSPAAGGMTATGGSMSPGGSPAGGSPAMAGMNASGGMPSTGGTAGESPGGASPGGSPSTGGVPPMGGAPAAGSAGTAAGGDTSMGGATLGTVKKFVGNISPKNKDIPTDFADKWMQVSMEANSKWGFVQPNSADDWVWEPVDQVYQYAKDHGIVFKEHNFFWNFEQPSWVTSSNVATVGETWVKTFCERYPDEYDKDHDTYADNLQKLLDAGAPIDAIGAQGHDVYKVGADKAKTYLDDFATRFPTLPVYITEVDIDQADDAKQATLMEEEITAFWDYPTIHGITYWGFLQGSTWRANAWLVSTSGTERPAMTWLQQFIAAHR